MSDFKEKLKTIQFGNVTAPPQREMEKQLFGKDRDAYHRLRMDGVQPKGVRHAAELEARANTQREIELGRIINPTAWKQAGSMIEDAEATARTANTTPNNDFAKTVGEKVRGRAATA